MKHTGRQLSRLIAPVYQGEKLGLTSHGQDYHLTTSSRSFFDVPGRAAYNRNTRPTVMNSNQSYWSWEQLKIL